MGEPINANPTVLQALPSRYESREDAGDEEIERLLGLSVFRREEEESETEEEEEIDPQEVYDLVSGISDPEHPLTLGQLAVVSLEDIAVSHGRRRMRVAVEITPTITHCSLATLIGLGVRVRLERSLPARAHPVVGVKAGSHESAGAVTRQLGDKERVHAACENGQLAAVISKMLDAC